MPRKPGANQYALSSCQRCRVKKLKCDDKTDCCRNCSRFGLDCKFVDPHNKNLYSRSHVNQLRERIKELEDEVRWQGEDPEVGIGNYSGGVFPPQDSDTDTPTMRGATVLQNTASATGRYHGTGSVISIAKLVAAAVSAKATGHAFAIALGDTAGLEAFQADYNRAQAAKRPESETAQQILTSYLGGFHVLHPFLQQSQLEELFSEMSNPNLDIESVPSDAFRYFMVCAIGALRLVRSGSHDTPAINYYTAAMAYKQRALDVTGIDKVQNILLILVFGVLYETGISNKWDLARLAMRSCIENGLHRPGPPALSPMEHQMRRRIFWATYILERQASVTVGRPFAIADCDISVELPIDVDDELIGLPNCLQVQAARGPSMVSAQIRQIKIRQFSSRTQQILSRPEIYNPETRSSELNKILEELAEWRSSIPSLSDGPTVYQTKAWIDLNYHKERLSCLKFLAFQQSPTTVAPKGQDLRLCLEASIGVAENYLGIASSEERVMNWMCVQDIMSAGFSILYCLHFSQQLHNLEATLGVDGILLGRAFDAINTCSNFLTHISSRWKTIGKQEKVFSTLATEIRRQVEHCISNTNSSTNGLTFDMNGTSVESFMPRSPSHLVSADHEGYPFSPGQDLFANVDFDNVNWDQIFASGQDSLVLDDIGL